ncbi:uncharacterized protein METZ01_LOCUS272619 [marine metagenome]|uniref:eRF1 domain-containing protein n=1 Tax=marine metagenome TaxID=408172 RepID=A0A382K7W6_9ZZZZ
MNVKNIHDIDLRYLSEITSNSRAFLSLYFNGIDNWKIESRKLKKIEVLLRKQPDELEHFKMNVKMLEKELKNNPKYKLGSVAAFCCWAMDFCEVYALPVPVSNMTRIDSSPFIRPLAELNDDYESYAVVITDNRSTKIFLVSSGVSSGVMKNIKGNIKNQVKVGGWSQKRYSRRRDNQIHHYSKEIASELVRMDKDETFNRIILVGSKETIKGIRSLLPPSIKNKEIIDKTIDLGRSEKEIKTEIDKLIGKLEVETEKNLWEKLKNELFQGGLGVVGIDEVIRYAEEGRIDCAIIEKNLYISGVRCRKCEHLQINMMQCSKCKSNNTFEVGIINELVELLTKSNAEIEFCEKIEELQILGGVGGLLRY